MPAAFGHGLQQLDRKQKKPLMEKRRRARINKCLHDLKGLLLESLKRDPAHTSKLEKADILEMTVLMLKDQQRRQLATAVSIDSSVFDRYLSGWAECLAQVIHYANNVEGFNQELRQRMVQHLESTYRTLIANKQYLSGVVPSGAIGTPLPPVSKLFPATAPLQRRSGNPGNPWQYLMAVNAAGISPGQSPAVPPPAGFALRSCNEIMGLISAMEKPKNVDSASSPTDNEANTSKSESENSGQCAEVPSYDDVTDPGSDSSVFGGDELADLEDVRSRSSSVDVGNSEPSTPGHLRKDSGVWRPW